ncbi:MAG: helix-hairpin-helix domain-containing protein [Candidatus Poribacteria bacterium]|nr:helix-hairpin-helix domain-containing protein [Candidatus Poribacteria bacterium]
MREYRNTLFRYRGSPAKTTSCFSDSNGLSLVSTLWILTILSVLAMQLLYSFKLENNARRNFVDRVKYHYAAKAGFEWGIAKLRTDETNFDSLGETWAEPVQQQIDDGIQIGRMLNYQVTITDEASKININSAPEDTIRNLLGFLGVQPENSETGDLAARIVEGRPYRTVRDVARVEGMMPNILYGIQQQTVAAPETSGSEDIPPQIQTTMGGNSLVDIATVYSVDANTDSSGQQRININSANAQQLTQIRGNNNQSVFSQAEANAIIQNRESNEFSGLSALLDVPAISNQVFNNISSRITVQNNTPANNNNNGGENNQFGGGGNNQFGDEENQFGGGGNNQFGGGGNNQGDGANNGGNANSLININMADSDELQELQGVDEGIADRIIAHRNSQGQFQNINAIRNVRILTVQEFAGIVDKITTEEGQTVNGLININTAPLEILQLLPGMDQTKSQAIITRREEETQEKQQGTLGEPIRGNPFSDIGQLLDIEEIDNQTFREVVDWVTYRSHGYRIESAAVDLSGKTIAKRVGIVVRNNNQLNVPYLRQD